MMLKYANYWLAFIFCITGTIMAALSKYPDAQWLLISDMNVALWLTVAAILDNRRSADCE